MSEECDPLNLLIREHQKEGRLPHLVQRMAAELRFLRKEAATMRRAMAMHNRVYEAQQGTFKACADTIRINEEGWSIASKAADQYRDELEAALLDLIETKREHVKTLRELRECREASVIRVGGIDLPASEGDPFADNVGVNGNGK